MRLNTISITSVCLETEKKYYFTCPRGIHDSEEHLICTITRNPNTALKCHECESFGQWCLDNNQKHLIDLWDIGLNKKSPFNISAGKDAYYYFNCDKAMHKSSKFNIYDITRRNAKVRCKYCNSLAAYIVNQFGENGLSNYWDYEKNLDLNPYLLSDKCDKKVWIKCNNKDYHGSYEIRVHKFTDGQRCPYCNSKRVHKNDSLAAIYPKSLYIWGNQNNLTPYEYACQSHKKVFWKCDSGIHGDYIRSVDNATKLDFECPACAKERTCSKLQSKVEKYILSNYSFILHKEVDCSIIPKHPKNNYSMPYDNEVVEIKLLIEVMGVQHYRTNSWVSKIAEKNNITPEQQLRYQRLKDRYKRLVAYYNKYSYLEIPYWSEKDGLYKEMIDNKIQEILNC